MNNSNTLRQNLGKILTFVTSCNTRRQLFNIATESPGTLPSGASWDHSNICKHAGAPLSHSDGYRHIDA